MKPGGYILVGIACAVMLIFFLGVDSLMDYIGASGCVVAMLLCFAVSALCVKVAEWL